MPDPSADRFPRPLGWAIGACLVVLVALHGFWSLTRERRFTPDSRNYVNVARNLLAGRGLVQDSVGFGEGRFPAHPRIPQPLGVHAPLYPIAIAALGLLGVDAREGALVLPVVAAGAILPLAFVLLRRLYGLEAGLLGVALLVAAPPLWALTGVAWSEGLAVALLLGALNCVVEPRPARLLAGGLLAGLAFATRYPLAAAGPLGCLLLLRRDGAAGNFRRLVPYAAGLAVAAVPIVARNLVVTGRLTGAVRNPSTVGLAENLGRAAEILLGQSLWPSSSFLVAALQAGLVLGLVAATALRLLRRRQLGAFLLEAGRAWPWVIGIGYALYLALQRSVIHFDYLHARLLAPSVILLLCVVAACLAEWAPMTPRAIALLVIGTSLARAGSVALEVAATPAADERSLPTARLRWAKKQAGVQDLIIGERTTDLAFYLGRASLYLTTAPEMQHVTAAELCSALQETCPRYRNVYLLLSSSRPEKRWRGAYGPFLTEVALGRHQGDPRLERIGEVGDDGEEAIYRAACVPCGVPGVAPAR